MSAMNMDKQLKRVALVGLALLVILMINANWIQGSQAEKLQTHKLNNRQFQDTFLRDRGDILSSDGERLAFSVKLDPSNPKSKFQRRYIKDGEIFVPVTGFFAGTLQKSGLEVAFNSVLDGRDKRQNVDEWLRQITGEKPLGANVHTTLDAKAQRIAYKQLEAQNPRRAAAVVLDVKTGAIKVAASYPSFDPNTISDIKNPGKDQQKLEALSKQRTSQPLINKALMEVFPPGSSFKTVVAAAFLEKGNNKDSLVPAPREVATGGSKPIGNSHNDNICGQPQSPLIGTFAQSCNTTYALLGVDDGILGNEAVRAQSEKFGFYKPIKIEDDFTAPASQYPHNNQNRDEILRGSFGQGETKATPLQMAMVAAAIGNGGTMMKPYLVDRVMTRVPDKKGGYREGAKIDDADQQSMGKPLSGDSADDLQAMMREVVNSGTANNLRGQSIAGKTGTTELDGNNGGAWFIGFAPADNPKYAFAAFVEGSTSIFGASTAGPIALAITNSLLKK